MVLGEDWIVEIPPRYANIKTVLAVSSSDLAFRMIVNEPW
jgi:hypothetical protein